MATALDSRMSSLADVLADSIGELAAGVMARVEPELPDWMRQPGVWEISRDFSRESIAAQLDCLREGGRLPEVCPRPDEEGARDGARAGVPLNALLRGYRVGHAVQWEAWLSLVEEWESDQAARRELLERGSTFFFAYADQLSRFVTDVYIEERDRMLRDREQQRMYLVRELLDGGSVDPDALDYDVSSRHLGLVAWGPEAADAAQRLADLLDRRLLIVRVAEDTWWGWLGASGPLSAAARRTLDRFDPGAGARIALGDEDLGPEGLRRTHHQALKAQRAGFRLRAPLVPYHDVALEALAGSDEDEARAFAERELAGLLGDDKRSAKLRDTLRSYFAHGHNAAATAADLGVHEQTVALRLRAAEDKIGHPVATRRAELETALRLRDYLPVT